MTAAGRSSSDQRPVKKQKLNSQSISKQGESNHAVAPLQRLLSGMDDGTLTFNTIQDFYAQPSITAKNEAISRMEVKNKMLVAMHSFVPRVGEVVLFHDDEASELVVCSRGRPVFDDFQTYHSEVDLRLKKIEQGPDVYSLPTWKAGVVWNVPCDNNLLSATSGEKGLDCIYLPSGPKIRIQLYNRSHLYGKHYPEKIQEDDLRCVNLNQTRPFSLFEELLSTSDSSTYDDLHVSVKAALKISPLYAQYGPVASMLPINDRIDMYLGGIYYGQELIIPGDIVRLSPVQEGIQSEICEVMLIKEIVVEIHKFPGTRGVGWTTPTISGIIYTSKQQPQTSDQPSHWGDKEFAGSPPSIRGYKLFRYRRSDGISVFGDKVRLARVVGRCYEKNAMRLLAGTSALGTGAAMKRIRRFATNHLCLRHSLPQNCVLGLAESRGHQLHLNHVNGIVYGTVSTKDLYRETRRRMETQMSDVDEGGQSNRRREQGAVDDHDARQDFHNGYHATAGRWMGDGHVAAQPSSSEDEDGIENTDDLSREDHAASRAADRQSS